MVEKLFGLLYNNYMNTKKHFSTTYDLILSALFIAFITVGAFIKIPVGPVPITLQFIFVLLAGHILKWQSVGIALIIYTVLGVLGIPVFSGGGGLSYVLTPSFGYIVGFVFAAIIVSLISHNCKQTFLRFLVANFMGLFIVYICGLGYYILLNLFYFNRVVDFSLLLITGFVIFIPTDVLFCVLTALISKRIKPILSR